MFMTDTIFKNLFQKSFMDWKTKYISVMYILIIQICSLDKIWKLNFWRDFDLFSDMVLFIDFM